MKSVSACSSTHYADEAYLGSCILSSPSATPEPAMSMMLKDERTPCPIKHAVSSGIVGKCPYLRVEQEVGPRVADADQKMWLPIPVCREYLRHNLGPVQR